MTDDARTLNEALALKRPMLRLTKPMMHGPAVGRLQELLGTFEYLPVDGIFGPQTEESLKLAQENCKVKVDGVYGPVTEAALHFYLRHYTKEVIVSLPSLLDISEFHKKPRNYSYERCWDQIRGVTLHQTGCAMPDSPLNWGRVNAHYGLQQRGQAILINPPTDMIWHAQSLSPATIGVEIEGNYCGVRGDMSTLWKGGGGPHHLNVGMLWGAKVIRDDIARRFNEAGKKWKWLYAHRQSSMNRRADPGSEIWQSIALDWEANTECVIDGNYARRNGRPLPKEWGAYNGKY